MTKNAKRMHFIGVGGVGMAGLAVLMKARGLDVSGCDVKASARTRWLEAQGIRVSIGHSPDHLKDADEVVVTPAVPKDAAEFALAAKNAATGRCRLRCRGEVLAELVNENDGIAVCGSHGKTTTSTWTARLLLALGEPVSWCIGGETGAFPVAGAGAGPLVVEADESDGTLAFYRAKTLVVTNCEYDHPDHFKTVADYFACFETAKRNAGTVIESEKLEPLAGLSGLEFLESLAPHNRKNARTAVEVALRRGHALADIAKALSSIVGELPDRRFQRIWPLPPNSHIRTFAHSNNFLVYTDYAHHPTEMRIAVGMARKICRGTLRVLYQPHRYSRTKALLADFPAAFDGADEVVLCPTYAAFEQPVEGGDSADLYRVCREEERGKREEGRGERFLLARSCEEAWEHARNLMKEGDLTLLLGAGDIIGLVPRVRTDLAAQAPTLF